MTDDWILACLKTCFTSTGYLKVRILKKVTLRSYYIELRKCLKIILKKYQNMTILSEYLFKAKLFYNKGWYVNI